MPGATKRHHDIDGSHGPAKKKQKIDNNPLLILEYDALAHPKEDLPGHILVLFENLSLLSVLKKTKEEMLAFITDALATYRDVPYHNAYHATCVTQMAYMLLVAAAQHLGNPFSKEEELSLLLAALCHDMDHPGVNNDYLVATHDDLAIEYNDRSPLENHHCATGFRLMRSSKHNLFSALDEDTYRAVRDRMVSLILATDLKNHKTTKEAFAAALEAPFSWDDDDHRLLLLKVMLEACDISNEARPREVSVKWSDRVYREFFEQGDKERAAGMPLPEQRDRTKCHKAKDMMGFVDFLLRPTWGALGQLSPALVAPFTARIDANYAEWQKVADASA